MLYRVFPKSVYHVSPFRHLPEDTQQSRSKRPYQPKPAPYAAQSAVGIRLQLRASTRGIYSEGEIKVDSWSET